VSADRVRPAPPSGTPPPEPALLAGAPVPLRPLAEAVAARYFDAYPEDLERYGEAGRQWEVHDTQHLLNWAVGDVEGHVDLERQVSWLAAVLEARGFPLDHLAGNLELAAAVVDERMPENPRIAIRLRAAGRLVRGTTSFLR
jgi:hypothetical protein